MNIMHLLKNEEHMKANSNTPEYWTMLESFNGQLATFVRVPGNLKGLTTEQLLNVCRMVGSYRPMALHTFLIYAAKEVE